MPWMLLDYNTQRPSFYATFAQEGNRIFSALYIAVGYIVAQAQKV